MITLVMEKTSVVEVALVAAMVVVVDMVAVGMAMDLIIMETILEVAEPTMILATTTSIFKFWTHERMKLWREKFWLIW